MCIKFFLNLFTILPAQTFKKKPQYLNPCNNVDLGKTIRDLLASIPQVGNVWRYMDDFIMSESVTSLLQILQMLVNIGNALTDRDQYIKKCCCSNSY